MVLSEENGEMVQKANENKKRINFAALFSDFPEFSEITEDVRSQNAKRVFTGGVRINNGMYRTAQETETYIKKSLERKLP